MGAFAELYVALKKENIPEKDKKKITGFVDDLALEGISEIRRKNYIQRLRVAAGCLYGFIQYYRCIINYIII